MEFSENVVSMVLESTKKYKPYDIKPDVFRKKEK